DLRVLRRGNGYLNNVDAEESGIGIFFRSLSGTSSEFLPRSHLARSLSIDVDVRLVLRIHDQRMRVRSATGLDGGDLLRLSQIADIKDSDPAKTLGADRRLHALHSAVDAASGLFYRHEEQVPVDGNVPLPARAHNRHQKPGLFRIFNVVRVEAVE